jgi:NAD(P)-dependent dehydrogenase (short-subunit alcohol dehydrogenase family)
VTTNSGREPNTELQPRTLGLLSGKVGVVTGAASGIGRATAEAALREGARLILVDRTPWTPGDGRNDQGPLLLAEVADLGEEADRRRVIEAILALGCAIDFMCNNAGVTPHYPFDTMAPEQWRRCLAVNLDAPTDLTRGLLPALRASSSASVVNISSIHAAMTRSNLAAYASSKAGLLGLTYALANELGPLGIRVNAITPGYIDTGYMATYSERSRTWVEQQHPLRRVGVPDEVANVAIFLFSHLASFMTGAVLAVDGGLSVHLPGPSEAPGPSQGGRVA